MYKRPYVESSVFIAYIKGEVINGQDRKAVVDAILKAAEEGDFPICTSSLTIAKVFKTKNTTRLTGKECEDLRPILSGEVHKTDRGGSRHRRTRQ
jgi:hypothetical protein